MIASGNWIRQWLKLADATPKRVDRHTKISLREEVIAFDVGTTFSGASFAKLEPGRIPDILGVTRYPAQHKVGGNSKIPSIIYYNANGNVQAVGAEAMDEAFLERAEDEGYAKVEWFKLHLRPKELATHISDKDLPSLPAGKRPIDVFADFLQYLFDCTRKFIVEMTYDGESYWKSVQDNIDFVLTHPNGWEGCQQALMPKAAAKAGLVDKESAQAQVQFVTEGEASLHYCIAGGTLNAIENMGGGIIIVDAGGGTIDLSAYQKTGGGADGGWSFQEIAPVQCHLQGSIFVTRRAREYLKGRLSGTRFVEDVQHISECFDATTKLGFRDRSSPYYIRFGGRRDIDKTADIRNGQMKLNGDVVAGFFQPSINAILQAIKTLRRVARMPVKTVLIVGGFAASDWLFSRVREGLGSDGLMVFRPDGHLNKAVADGAVLYYLDHIVTKRAAKFSYGIESTAHYEPAYADHLARRRFVYRGVSGRWTVPGVYSEILAKGTVVEEETEFRRPFVRDYTCPKPTNIIEDEILCYRGEDPPAWISDAPQESFSTLCTIKSDVTTVQLRPGINAHTKGTYYILDFEIILLLGLTELKAQVAWKENGVEKRCPAVVVYDDE
ncbi:hypothetical protein CYLTODRAFT_438236 [Cylindrobasidium torrendii FP15055 ss-10]|uniref:Actin-like ATPase domain-containing protein n=1 Tax=Cylindrobasidium torrendii FP15055 ss-10 TaxID=1314674 RepID=A0A0D7B4C8_9AGAR|nr:hypothetical protein CYLTODRAFT_438236 [Cylindrobasidium torrendii FP15055 ss-10]